MNFSRIISMTILVGLAKGTFYSTQRKKSITEQSATLQTFPSEQLWNNADISKEKRAYFDSSFSKAFYERECEYETILKPVYYYSGETVSLECFMCNIALVLNGSPKKWGRIRNIDDFMEKGRKFGSKDGPDIEMVENSEYLEDEKLTPVTRKLGEPYYHQSNGFLIINNANAYSQGVYFCFDEDSVASQRHFYVLMPILPVFQISKQIAKDQIKTISNNCSDSVRSFPDHFWSNYNKADPFDDQETCFTRNGFNDWSCYDSRSSIRIAGCENPALSCKLPISSPTLPMNVPISISLQWSPWSECEFNKQQRLGQCFFSLDRQLSESDVLTKKWDWLWKLNRMSNNISFREGVPLFSGLIAAWLYGVDSLESCLDSELGAESIIDGYDIFFSEIINSIQSNTTNKFDTPLSAFKYCLIHRKLDRKYDVLQGTYTRDERMSEKAPAPRNHMFYVLTNGDVIYKFNDLHFVVRSRKILESIRSLNYVQSLTNVSIHEPTPSLASTQFLQPLDIPVFSQLINNRERYVFRNDYQPYVVRPPSNDPDSYPKGSIHLYVLAGSKLDRIRTKIALSLSAVAPQPYHDYGMVSLLVYLPPNGSLRPFLSLITGDCSTERVERAVMNAVDSGRIPYFRWEEDQLLHDVNPIVRVYNEEETLESYRRSNKTKVVKEDICQPPEWAPDPIPQPEAVDLRRIPYIDEDDKNEEGTSDVSSGRREESVECQPGPSSKACPVSRLVSNDLKDSGVSTMPSVDSSQIVNFTDPLSANLDSQSLNNVDDTSREDSIDDTDLALMPEEEVPVEDRIRVLTFDVIHMPPFAKRIGRFFKNFKANYYILPTGKGNGFSSKEAVKLNTNIRSGCIVIPTEQTVDNGWHDGKIKVTKYSTGMKRLHKICEPIKVNDGTAIFKEYADPYGKLLMQRTKRRVDYLPPPDVYEQKIVVLGGVLKNGASFPMWPDSLAVPRKVQKVFNIKCVCSYCRYDLKELYKIAEAKAAAAAQNKTNNEIIAIEDNNIII